MIVRGLGNINSHLAQVKAENLADWYDHNPRAVIENIERRRRNPHPTRSQRRYMQRQAEREQSEREMQERCNREMYEAMGPDYDPNAFAMFP